MIKISCVSLDLKVSSFGAEYLPMFIGLNCVVMQVGKQAN
jgi:hypothetical protein